MAVRRIESDKDKALLNEAQSAFTARRRWEPIWEDAFSYYIPERLVRDSSRPDPTELYAKIYDSTPVTAVEKFANILLSGLVPPWTRWVLLAPGPEVPREDRAKFLRLLQPINDILFLNLNFSNLHQELQPALLDAAVSTGCIRIDKAELGGPSALKFTNIPLDAIALRAGADGRLDHVYYKTKRMARLILGKYRDELPDEVREDLEKIEFQEVDITVICRPVEAYSTRVRYVEILDDFELILEDTQLPWQPFIAFRLGQVAGEVYGRGPALLHYGDTRTLNKVREYELKSTAMTLLGIWVARHDGVMNPYTVDLQPGAIIPVMDTNPNNIPIRRVDPPGTAFAIGQGLVQNMRQDIKDGFYNDRFGPVSGPKMTATEVLARAQVIAQELGAIYSRVVAELLNPLIERSVAVLKSAGLLPGLEDLRVDNKLIQPVYLASLAQAQRLQEMQNILQLAGISVQMGQVDPNAGLVVNYEEVVRRVAEALTVPQELLRSPEDIQKLQQQAQEALMAMQQGPQAGELTPFDQALTGGV